MGGLTERGQMVAGRCSATEVGAARAASGSGRGGPGGLGGGSQPLPSASPRDSAVPAGAVLRGWWPAAGRSAASPSRPRSV